MALASRMGVKLIWIFDYAEIAASCEFNSDIYEGVVRAAVKNTLRWQVVLDQQRSWVYRDFP
jgi:hypothetical protein